MLLLPGTLSPPLRVCMLPRALGGRAPACVTSSSPEPVLWPVACSMELGELEAATPPRSAWRTARPVATATRRVSQSAAASAWRVARSVASSARRTAR
eukprot:366027-Chlamydomonas_euryale.AAC.11